MTATRALRRDLFAEVFDALQFVAAGARGDLPADTESLNVKAHRLTEAVLQHMDEALRVTVAQRDAARADLETLHAAHARLQEAVAALAQEIHRERSHAQTPYATPFNAAVYLPRWQERLLQALDAHTPPEPAA